MNINTGNNVLGISNCSNILYVTFCIGSYHVFVADKILAKLNSILFTQNWIYKCKINTVL